MDIFICKVSELISKLSEDAIYQMIPDYRKQSADRCKNEKDRQRSLAVSYLLCQAMEKWNVSKEEIPTFSKSGKMYFDSNLMFYVNLSHAADYAVCAVDSREIGIDVECMRKYRESVAKKAFSKELVEQLEKIDEVSIQDAAFTKAWTEAESRIKLSGRGLAELLDHEQSEQTIYYKTFQIEEHCYVSVASYENQFSEQLIWI